MRLKLNNTAQLPLPPAHATYFHIQGETCLQPQIRARDRKRLFVCCVLRGCEVRVAVAISYISLIIRCVYTYAPCVYSNALESEGKVAPARGCPSHTLR